MKEKPPYADLYNWNKFVAWTQLNGIEDHTDDWTAWWDCWKYAYILGITDGE
jgi:hypothetical protein